MHTVKAIKDYGFTTVSIIRKDGSFYIKKELTSDNPYYKKLFNNEIKILKELSHKNIISLKEVNLDENYFLQEYCELGDLKNYIYKYQEKFKEKRDYTILKIIEGLTYLHSKNIVHNDLKLSNIFLAKGNKVKIGDFGLSSHENENFFSDFPAYIFKGTFSLNKNNNEQKISKKADLYSLGVIVFEMYSFKDPSFNEVNTDLIDDIYIKNFVKNLLSDTPPLTEELLIDFKSNRRIVF